jgi:hypothetical protein
VFDPASIVRRNVYVVVEVLVNQISHSVALLLSHVRRSIGESKTPSHVHPEAVIINQLTDISR